MADQGWGPAPAVSAESVQTGSPFVTAELRNALPTDGDKANGHQSNGDHDTKPVTPAGWVQATPYDYKSYAADADHEWASNAKVYEWDGEEGEVGPEFPALEMQLFGEPGSRAKQGIDFTK